MISALEKPLANRNTLMDTIFITPLTEPMESWLTAFPDLSCVTSAVDLIVMQPDTTIWLHQLSSQPQDFQQTIQCIQTLRERHAQPKVVVMTNQPDTAQTVAMIQAGALGCCHAYSDPTVLSKVQHVVSEGGLWLGEAALQQLIEATQTIVSSSPISVDTLMAKLTRREQQVAKQVVKGLTNKQIARKLGITERTVKAHMASIFERLGAKDRLQLALMLTQKK